MLGVRARKPGGAGPKLSAKGQVYLLTAYLLFFGGFLFWYGGLVGPEALLIVMLLGVVILGKTRAFLRDWTPFALIFLVWQLLRGYGDNAARGLGFPLHSADIIAVERWLFRGHLPNVVLQRAFYMPGQIGWLDIVTTGFWAFHFVLPLLFAFLLWMRDRTIFHRFTWALLLLSFAGFATSIVFPAVPPWLAATARFGDIADPIALIRLDTVGTLAYGPELAPILVAANPNMVAAMPSLHAAYPTLVLFFTLVYWRRLAPIAALYCCGLWFSIVYIGDHYVVDALAGTAYAGLSFLAIIALERTSQHWRGRATLGAGVIPAPTTDGAATEKQIEQAAVPNI